MFSFLKFLLEVGLWVIVAVGIGVGLMALADAWLQ